MGLLVWFSYFLPEIWSLNGQSVSVLQFFPDVSERSKAVMAIYVYSSERSRSALLENGIGYYAMS